MTVHTKEGEKRTVYEVEVEVDDVGPSLRNASAKVTRVSCTGSGDGAASGRGQRASGGRPSSGQGNADGRESDPWATDSPVGYSDEPPF